MPGIFSGFKLSAPSAPPKHSNPPDSPTRHGADELMERQKAKGAAWHFAPLREALPATSLASSGPSYVTAPSGSGSDSAPSPDGRKNAWTRPGGAPVGTAGKPLPQAPPRHPLSRPESSSGLRMPAPEPFTPRPQNPMSAQSSPASGPQWRPSAASIGSPARDKPQWAGSYGSPGHRPVARAVGPRPPRPPMETRPYSDPQPLYHRPYPQQAPSVSPSDPKRQKPSPSPRPYSTPPSSSVSDSRPSARSTPQPAASRGTPPASPKDKLRCHGTTAQGKRCTRPVSSFSTKPRTSPTKPSDIAPPAVGLPSHSLRGLEAMLAKEDAEEGAGGLPRFCKQHEKQAMSEPGAFAGPKGVWIRFDDWIPAELPLQTKLHLRSDMLKPPTATDASQAGYIYVHEMAPPATVTSSRPKTTYIKLGRALRPVDRLSQWTSQCPSRTPIVRGFFPASAAAADAYLRGAQTVAEQGGPFHIRWERLCLVELAGWEAVERFERRKAGNLLPDESSSDDGWTSDEDGGGAAASPVRGHKGGVRRSRDKGKTCADCGRRHVELFEFSPGAFERRVRAVVVKWEKWCAEVLAR